MRATSTPPIAIALALAGGAPWTVAHADDAAAKRRSGKAVRVPRATAAVTTAARFCALSEDDRGVCFAPVQVGDGGAVLSTDGSNWGQTEILEVTPNQNRCGQAETWSIRIDRGRLSATYYDYGATLVVGMNLAPTAQLLPASRPVPDGNDLASINYVVDADGDDQADLIADQYGCDLARRPVRSGNPTHLCTEYWVAIRDRWQRARVDQLASCQR